MLTDAQKQSLQNISERANELIAKGEELTPNVDEVMILANDLAAKAVDGAETLVSDVLDAVSDFLAKLG